MAKLTAAQRKRLPASDFAGPNRTYPDPDASHGRNALARVANKSPALKARVEAAVHHDFPNIGKVSHHHHGSAAMARKHGGKR